MAWLDGSLFFRAVMSVMDFLRRVCAGSFLVGLFSAEYDGDKLRRSFFVRTAGRLINIFPTIITPPAYWPKRLSHVLGGSFIIRTACDALDTPLPPPYAVDGKHRGAGVLSVIQWLLASASVWGLLLVTAGAPFLPTMILAGLVVAFTALAFFRYDFTLDITGISLLVFIAVTLFYGVTSFTPGTSLPIALLTTALMFSFFTVTACCRKRAQLDFFLFTFLSAAAGTGLIGLYQFITKKVDTTWLDVNLFEDITFRMYSSFDNPNVYGTYLLLAIPLCAAMVLYARKPLYKLAALGVTALLLFNMAMTYSRGCYLALAVAALVFALLIEKRLVVLLAGGMCTLPFILPATIINRLLSITNLTDSSTSFRISIWQASLRILQRFWLVGLGQGNEAFNTVFPRYAFNAVSAQHAHNLFLQLFVETGIVGLLAFVAVLACFYRQMVCYLRKAAGKRTRIIAAAAIAATTGFLFQGMFDYVFYNYKVMLTFFIFMGLCCAFTQAGEAGSD